MAKWIAIFLPFTAYHFEHAREVMMLRALMIVPVLGIGLAMPVAAQQNNPLPSSGTFKLHSGWKGIGETTKISDNHTFGSGNFWGVSFNDAGSGPLHVGPVVCAYTLDTVGGADSPAMSARFQHREHWMV